MIKDAVEGLYFDKCTIYGYENITDEKTHQTQQVCAILYEDIPCRLVYKQIQANGQVYSVPTIGQSVKLLLNPDICVVDGCEIHITKQTGQTVVYKSSGEPAFYPSHQEIMLVPERDYA